MNEGKRRRELTKMAQAEGLQVLCIETTGGCHIRVVVKHPHHPSAALIAPLTPSDRRGDLNLRASMRRAARGQTA